MTAVAAALLGAAAAAALVDWVAVGTDRTRLEWVAKPATLALLLAAAAGLDPSSGGVRPWFLVALALSLAGDVLLMLPGDRFAAGLAAFLAAHVAYVAGFAADDGHHVLAGVVGAALVAVGVATVGWAVVAGARRRSPALAGPVVAYVAVLSTMAVAGWSTGEPAAMAGTSLFLASDGTLAWDRFVAEVPGGRVAVHVTYHAAQALLVLSLLA